MLIDVNAFWKVKIGVQMGDIILPHQGDWDSTEGVGSVTPSLVVGGWTAYAGVVQSRVPASG